MSADTKSVDVLAVQYLHELAGSYAHLPETAADIRAQAAAVADLIEAANGAHAALANGYEIRNSRRALELALARVQGGAK